MPTTITLRTGTETLPRVRCIRHVTTDETIAIRRAVDDFTPVNTSCSPKRLNARLPPVPTENEITTARHGSLTGWDMPDADPGFWRRRREAIR